MQKVKERKEIEEKFKWDLTKIFKNKKVFNKFYEETKRKIEEFKKHENHVMDSASSLYETILDYLDISRGVEKLYTYAHMLKDQDISDNDNGELVSRVLNLYDLANKNTYFVKIEILKEEYSKIEKFYKDEPKLLEHEKNIKDIYKYKDHTLSDEEEKLLSSITKSFGNDETTYSYLTNSDMTLGTIKDEEGHDVELTNTNFVVYIRSNNRKVRKSAFETIYTRYKQFKNTICSTFSSHIKQNVSIANVRKYNSAFESTLFEDDLTEDVYNALVSTVHENMNVIYNYYALKKEIMGLDELHLYDVYKELVEDYDKKYSFEEAKDIIFKALSVLGEDYTKDLERAFSERWIDIYPNKCKCSGAYSSGSYDTYPYLLLNYQEKLDDVSTMIHELGHSMHSYYTRTNQPYQYGNYPIFVAEVASTTNELILAHYLIENSTNKKEKLAAINHLLELFKGTIFRQTMFEEFEKYAYDLVENDDVISADKLSDKYYELNKEYFGDNVIVDDEIRYEWERVPHFYYTFYVYKYATSLSAACDIVTRILNKEENALSSYLEMLKSGSSKTPLETLKIAGVDMTDKKVYSSAMKMFNDTIEKYKECLKEEN